MKQLETEAKEKTIIKLTRTKETKLKYNLNEIGGED